MAEHTCPYCGQTIMAASGEDPRMYCLCDNAMDYKDLMGQVDEAFVEVERHPVFRPVDEETYRLILSIADGLAAERIRGVSFTLADGSQCKISRTKVTRKLTIER